MKTSTAPASNGGFLISVFLLVSGVLAFAQGQETVQGVIKSVDPGGFVLTLADGRTQTVSLAKDTLVLEREPASLADITPGEALGVAAKKGADGSLTATSINIFSQELWKMAKKGQFPMESGEVMTNAVVDNLTTAMVMGRTLFMKYENLSAIISVPAEAEIHRILTVTESDLKPGLSVSVRGVAGSKGSLTAASVSFEMPKA